MFRYWPVVFLVLALAAALLSYGGMPALVTGWTRVAFLALLIVLVIWLVIDWRHAPGEVAHDHS